MADDGFTTIQSGDDGCRGGDVRGAVSPRGHRGRTSIRSTRRWSASRQQFSSYRSKCRSESEERARELLSELDLSGRELRSGRRFGDRGRARTPSPEPPAVLPRRPILAAGDRVPVARRRPFPRAPAVDRAADRDRAVLRLARLAASALLDAKGSFAGEMLFGALIALVFADAIGGGARRGTETAASTPRQLAPVRARLRAARVLGGGGRRVRQRGRDTALVAGAATGAVRGQLLDARAELQQPRSRGPRAHPVQDRAPHGDGVRGAGPYVSHRGRRLGAGGAGRGQERKRRVFAARRPSRAAASPRAAS